MCETRYSASPPACEFCDARNASTSESLTTTCESTSRSRNRWMTISLRMSSRYFSYSMFSFLSALAELVGRQLVVLRDAQDGALDLRVVDANAVLLGELQDRTLGDDPVEQLLVEHVGGRRRHVLRLHLRENGPLLVVDVELRHRLVVDDGDDAVEEHAAVGRRTRRARRGRPCGRCARLRGRRRRALRDRGNGNNGDRQRSETAKNSGKRHAVTLTRSV